MSVAVRVVVIGCGFIGRVHAKALQAAGLELVGAYDISPNAVAQVLRSPQNSELSMLELIKETEPHIAVVATPPGDHAPTVHELASAGVHVLCEKPLALNEADAVSAASACDNAGVSLSISFKMRYEPVFATTRRLILEGAIGTPVSLWFEHTQPCPSSPWAESTGIAAELLIHSIDLTRWITGEEPTRPAATAADRGTALTSTLGLTLTSGCRATLTGRWLESFPPLGGADDMIGHIVGEAGHLTLLRPDLVRVVNRDGVRNYHLDRHAYVDPFIAMWRDVEDRVNGGSGGALATAEDGVAASRALHAHAETVLGNPPPG